MLGKADMTSRTLSSVNWEEPGVKNGQVRGVRLTEPSERSKPVSRDNHLINTSTSLSLSLSGSPALFSIADVAEVGFVVEGGGIAIDPKVSRKEVNV